MINYILDIDKVPEIDFGIGNDEFKKSWMRSCRERWGIVAFNPRTRRGFTGALRHVMGRNVVTVFRRIYSGIRTARARVSRE